MAFSKKQVDARKEWLRAFVPGTFLDHGQSKISYCDFVNRVSALMHARCGSTNGSGVSACTSNTALGVLSTRQPPCGGRQHRASDDQAHFLH